MQKATTGIFRSQQQAEIGKAGKLREHGGSSTVQVLGLQAFP
jgi:hypothetical protein